MKEFDPVIQWFLNPKVRSQWNFTAEPFPNSQFEVLKGYSVQGKFRGVKVGGFGSDVDPQRAFVKAVAEAVERFVTRSSRIYKSSNGMAIHTNSFLAQKKARLELIERHLFLAHFLGGKRFFAPRFDVENLPYYRKSRQALKKAGARLFIWEMQRLGNIHSYLVVISEFGTEKRHGVLLGAAASENPEQAVISALNEAFSLWALMSQKKNGELSGSLSRELTLGQFLKIPNPQPLDRVRLGWSQDYVRRTDNYFFEGLPAKENRRRPFDIQNIAVKRVSICQDADFPFHIFRAYSTDCIDMYFHHLTKKEERKIIKKLNHFWRPSKPLTNFPSLPHVFA